MVLLSGGDRRASAATVPAHMTSIPATMCAALAHRTYDQALRIAAESNKARKYEWEAY